MAEISSSEVRETWVLFFKWYEAKGSTSTLHSRRAGVLRYFLWRQERSSFERLSEAVDCATAIDYSRHLRGLIDDEVYSAFHATDLYRSMKIFVDFVIEESLTDVGFRNPFKSGDMPTLPDPLPRFIADANIKKIHAYCKHEATLLESTLVTVLLHTGLRAAEVANLEGSDIVEV